MHNLIMINKNGKCEKRNPLWQYFQGGAWSTNWIINGLATNLTTSYPITFIPNSIIFNQPTVAIDNTIITPGYITTTVK